MEPERESLEYSRKGHYNDKFMRRNDQNILQSKIFYVAAAPRSMSANSTVKRRKITEQAEHSISFWNHGEGRSN